MLAACWQSGGLLQAAVVQHWQLDRQERTLKPHSLYAALPCDRVINSVASKLYCPGSPALEEQGWCVFRRASSCDLQFRWLQLPCDVCNSSTRHCNAKGSKSHLQSQGRWGPRTRGAADAALPLRRCR